MQDDEEYRFKIDSYTPATIPMARLAEYMADLAKLLGESAAVHFVRLEESSLVMVQRIKHEAVPKVRERVQLTAIGEAPADAMDAFKRLNTKLRQDNGNGGLYSGTAEVLEFPGRETAQPLTFAAFNQDGTLDGVPIKVGGTQERVPVLLQNGPILYPNCIADRIIAKRIAEHLFTSELRLMGTGRWYRDQGGDWRLEKFNIADFEVLDSAPLLHVVAALRKVPGSEWDNLADPWGELRAIRHGGHNEAQ